MTTTVITRPAALLHTGGEHLANIFNAVLAHTAKVSPDPDDFELPALTQVHVEVREGSLRLACSNRYSMGIVRQPMSSTSDGFATSFAVPAEDIRRTAFGDGETSLVVEENSLRITSNDSSHNFPGVRSELPWRGALEKVMQPNPVPTGGIALDPVLLARFQDAKPLSPEQPMLFRLSGQQGAVIATLDTTFLGLVMPINPHAAARCGLIPERPLDVWFDLLDEGPLPAASEQGEGSDPRG